MIFIRLIITEKTSVAQSIANVLSINNRKDGYLYNDEWYISWCVGHLVELVPPNMYDEKYTKWNVDDLPILPKEWQYIISERTKSQFNILKMLMNKHDVTSLVCATDSGREGELIYRLVYNMAGCKKPFSRLWISSLEESAIKHGFDTLKPSSEYDNLYDSAVCREQGDWLIGMNLSRLFGSLYGIKGLSVGRVMSPVLAILSNREQKIQTFKKEPFYTVSLECEKIIDKSQAEQIQADCDKQSAFIVSVEKQEKGVNPPTLFDLTTLQGESNRIYKLSASKILEIAQSLYEKKLITYPRTDASYLSEDMADTAQHVAETVCTVFGFSQPKQTDFKRIMNNTKIVDHHTIIPTTEIIGGVDSLSDLEINILKLISLKLISTISEPYVYESVKVILSCNNHTFTVTGKSVISHGWKRYEQYLKSSTEEQENSLTELYGGEIFESVKTKVNEKETSPPKKITEDTLLSAMEKASVEHETVEETKSCGLGTPATRAGIIEKLIDKGYVIIEKNNLVSSP